MFQTARIKRFVKAFQIDEGMLNRYSPAKLKKMLNMRTSDGESILTVLPAFQGRFLSRLSEEDCVDVLMHTYKNMPPFVHHKHFNPIQAQTYLNPEQLVTLAYRGSLGLYFPPFVQEMSIGQIQTFFEDLPAGSDAMWRMARATNEIEKNLLHVMCEDLDLSSDVVCRSFVSVMKMFSKDSCLFDELLQAKGGGGVCSSFDLTPLEVLITEARYDMSEKALNVLNQVLEFIPVNRRLPLFVDKGGNSRLLKALTPTEIEPYLKDIPTDKLVDCLSRRDVYKNLKSSDLKIYLNAIPSSDWPTVLKAEWPWKEWDATDAVDIVKAMPQEYREETANWMDFGGMNEEIFVSYVSLMPPEKRFELVKKIGRIYGENDCFEWDDTNEIKEEFYIDGMSRQEYQALLNLMPSQDVEKFIDAVNPHFQIEVAAIKGTKQTPHPVVGEKDPAIGEGTPVSKGGQPTIAPAAPFCVTVHGSNDFRVHAASDLASHSRNS